METIVTGLKCAHCNRYYSSPRPESQRWLCNTCWPKMSTPEKRHAVRVRDARRILAVAVTATGCVVAAHEYVAPPLMPYVLFPWEDQNQPFATWLMSCALTLAAVPLTLFSVFVGRSVKNFVLDVAGCDRGDQ